MPKQPTKTPNLSQKQQFSDTHGARIACQGNMSSADNKGLRNASIYPRTTTESQTGVGKIIDISCISYQPRKKGNKKPRSRHANARTLLLTPANTVQ